MRHEPFHKTTGGKNEPEIVFYAENVANIRTRK